MLVWGPEALCPPSGSLPVPAFLLGRRRLREGEVVMPPPTRDTDQESWGSHNNILGVVAGAGLTLFKTQGRSNTHLGPSYLTPFRLEQVDLPSSATHKLSPRAGMKRRRGFSISYWS